MRKLVVLSCLLVLVVGAASAWAVEAPKWLGAFPMQNKIGLKWNPVEGAQAYVVYRAVKGGAAEKIAEVTQTQYFDETAAPGETYEYTLKAVAEGAEGPASEIKSVAVPGVKKGEMVKPVWVGAREDRGRAMLRWDPLKGADVVAYNLQRSAVSGGPYETVASTQETKYLDTDVKNGQTYYYIVTALDANFQESAPSDELAYAHGAPADSGQAGEMAQSADMTPIPLELEFELRRAGEADLNAPADVVVAESGDIYVADMQNSRVAVFDSKGVFKFQFGKKATKGKVEDGAFELVFTLARGPQGNVYASDLGTGDIQVFDPAGQFVRRYPTGAIEGAKKFCPTGICVLPDGSMLVSDRDNDRFFKLDAGGKVLWTKGTKGEGDGQFVSPNEIGVNSKGNIYVLDVLNQRVQIFDQQGNFLTFFGGVGNVIGTFARPKGLYVDAEDHIWIADGMSNAIQVYGPDHKVHSTIGGMKDLLFSNPRGMEVKGGRFYLVDRNNNRVLVFRML